MKRTTATITALLSMSLGALAAGPAAPKNPEQKEAAPSSSAHPGQPAPASSSPGQQPGSAPAPGTTNGAAPAETPAAQPLPGSDQAFIQKAAEMNQYQIEMAKAATRISTTPEIRKAAQNIQRDLTTMRQQLESLASSKGITLPKGLPQNFRDQLTAAESRTAKQFDESYLQDQIRIQQQSITLFEREGERSSDVDIKAWAKQTVPGFKSHLSILKSTSLSPVGEKSSKEKAPAGKQ